MRGSRSRAARCVAYRPPWCSCSPWPLNLTYDHHRTQEACLKRNRSDPTHAGGVVFRRQGSLIEYLLVGPKKDDPKEWLFPKGHIELGEDHGTAALREVREETGVVAQLVCLLDQVEYKVADKEVRAKYYLMHALYEEEPAEARPSNGSPSPRLTAC